MLRDTKPMYTLNKMVDKMQLFVINDNQLHLERWVWLRNCLLGHNTHLSKWCCEHVPSRQENVYHHKWLTRSMVIKRSPEHCNICNIVYLCVRSANCTYMVSNDKMTHLMEELLICWSDIHEKCLYIHALSIMN